MAMALAIATGPAASQAAGEATAQGDVSVTIYNNGQALVQDVRQLPIARGITRIEFPDVSAQIRAETLSFNAADTAIMEQNFDYDLLTPTKLMEKAIGQTITIVRTNPATGAETRERATVLSTAGGVVLQIGDRIEVMRDDGLPVRAIFDRVPPNLRARPTLSVTLDSSRAGTRPASLRYLTPGLGWNADYVALFDEAKGSIDVQGWVTLNNSSGTTYHNANTLLVAGSPSSGGYSRPSAPRGMVRAGTQSADREQLGDYYLYPIAGRTTIANNQTKQVSFLDVQGVPARKVYAIGFGWMSNMDNPQSVNTAISFSSSSDGGLGDALPAGAVRFYQRDMRGSPQFIGESSIGHTPMGSTLSLTTGQAFDVQVKSEVVSREKITSDEWEQTARYRINRSDGSSEEATVERPKEYYRTNMRYSFTNARSQPVTVEMKQSGLSRYWWASDTRIPKESLTGEQINADTRLWQVPVPANGTAVLTVSYDTRY
ncbi:MAG: DUF4139 domain-containing protein [Blastomonas sp.]